VNRADIHFPPKHEPLRDDVHELGALVGEILREQGGPRLLELVEADRVAAIRGRGGEPQARAELAAQVRERPPALARDLVRAFSMWFQAVNIAEKVHRIRRRRDYFVKDSQRPQPGGVEDALAALKAQGYEAPEVAQLIGSLSIEPVFAPHSTEAGRRTLLRKQQRIAQRLLERLDPSLTPHEARSIWDNIRMELTSAWQTEELPRARLTVADEREQILFYLVEILYRVVPAFYEELAQALAKVYGATAARCACPPSCTSAPGRAGTWTATRTCTPRASAKPSRASSR
jgi:phosphoenolpyruvate carboxylase